MRRKITVAITVAELDKILNDPQDYPIVIQPDGSLKVDKRRKGKGYILTAETDLKSSY